MNVTQNPNLTIDGLHASARDVQQVLELERERRQALVDANIDVLDIVLSDDLHYTHTSGYSNGKQELISAIRQGDVIYHALDTTDLNAEIIGGLICVSGIMSMELEKENTLRSLRSFFKSLWINEHGHWTMRSWISTPIRS